MQKTLVAAALAAILGMGGGAYAADLSGDPDQLDTNSIECCEFSSRRQNAWVLLGEFSSTFPHCMDLGSSKY